MPMIRVEMSRGRTADQKRAVLEAITAAMQEHCGCTPESVHVVFFDVDNSDWGVGGRFLSDPK